MDTKKKTIIFAVAVAVTVAAVFLFKPAYKKHFKVDRIDRAAEARRVISSWNGNPFVTLTDSEELASGLETLVKTTGEALNERQKKALVGSLKEFCSAFGDNKNGVDAYMRFRLPTPWKMDEQIVDGVLKSPMPHIVFLKLDGSKATATNLAPIKAYKPEELPANDADKLRLYYERMSRGGLNSGYLEAFSPTGSTVNVWQTDRKPLKLNGYATAVEPSLKVIGSAEYPKSVKFERNLDVILREKKQALIADVKLLVRYKAPDHTGPIFLRMFWDDANGTWTPEELLQGGLFRETELGLCF